MNKLLAIFMLGFALATAGVTVMDVTTLSAAAAEDQAPAALPVVYFGSY
jgi:hypothetical protein